MPAYLADSLVKVTDSMNVNTDPNPSGDSCYEVPVEDVPKHSDVTGNCHDPTTSDFLVPVKYKDVPR